MRQNIVVGWRVCSAMSEGVVMAMLSPGGKADWFCRLSLAIR